MQVSKEKKVTLTFELRVDSSEGEVLQLIGQDQPMTYIHGVEHILPPFFVNELEGLSAGDKFEVNKEAKDAFGEVVEDAIVELPKNIFEVEGKIDEEMLTVGNDVPMMSANGERMMGVVIEVTDEIVKMDFNHSLAGEDLYISGAIVDVQEATAEELASAAAPQGGGCGGGCGSSDGGDCSSSCGSGEGSCGC